MKSLWIFAGLFLAVLGVTNSARADLAAYVQRPEADFKWQLVDTKTSDAGTTYDVKYVSQKWQGILWEHQLQIYQPKEVLPNGTMLLFNTGGGANAGYQLFGMELARRIKAPVAIVYHVPNQPLLDGKKEDTLIAETFVRYLDTKDANWPLLFPMVKTVVKGMDVLQAFTEEQWKQKVKQFVISGGSKRGWTSWLTGATGDPRVKGIAPLVIDTLNMRAQGPQQLDHFGKYSDMIRDYTLRGLLPMPDTAEAVKLWSMVDPWVYRDKLKLPKFIINGNNDPYWTTDALNLYWDDLQGDKWVLYVPNAGHDLRQKEKPLPDQMTKAATGLAAFCKHLTYDKPMPKVTWKHSEQGGNLFLQVEANPPPKGARLWSAAAPTRDFRASKWTDKPLEVSGNSVRAQMEPPASGCSAFYAELDYEIDGLPYQVSTQIRIAGQPVKK